MARLSREHLVAAGLVGTVVVVVGFASGLGLRQPSTDTAQAQQPRHVTPTVPATTSVQTTSPPPMGGGGGLSGGGPNPGIAVPQPVQMTSEPQFTHPAPTTTSATTTTTPSPSLPPCDPGLVRQLADTVDGTVGDLTGLLGLPSKPLTPVLDPLLGTCQPPATRSTSTSTPVPTP
jgi:hypothetical protein